MVAYGVAKLRGRKMSLDAVTWNHRCAADDRSGRLPLPNQESQKISKNLTPQAKCL